MRDTKPKVGFKEVIRGHGYLSFGEVRVSVPTFVVERSKYAVTGAWEFKGTFAPDEAPTAHQAVGNETRPRFEGITEDREPIVIPDLTLLSISGRDFSAPAYCVEIGQLELPAMPSEQWVSVYLTPTPLAMRRFPSTLRLSTGELTDIGEYHLPSIWTTAIGVFELELEDSREVVMVGDVMATIDVPRVVLSAKVNEPTQQVQQLISNVELELRYLAAVLSLLSRAQVSWNRVAVSSHRLEAEPKLYSTTMRGVIRSASIRPGVLEPLVSPVALATYDLDTLAHRLFQAVYRDALVVAIDFLNLSLGEILSVHNLFYVFTALETLASAIKTPEPPLSSIARQARRKVLRALRGALSTIKPADEHERVVVERATHRLPELIQPPSSIADRVARLIRVYNVEWADVFGDGNLEDSLRASFRMRNMLVHEGRMNDRSSFVPELFRLHIILRYSPEINSGRHRTKEPMSHLLGQQ